MSASEDAGDKAFRDDLVKNATRLIGDAVLLVEHDRFASAFALAVLALEEVGKLILSVWFPTGALPATRVNSHLRKQRAVAAMLLAEVAVEHVGSCGLNLETPTDAEVEGLARAMYESREARFSEQVNATALDRTKQLALYLDRAPISPDLRASDFTRVDAYDMLEKIKNAARLLGHPQTVSVGKALYVTWPEQFDRRVGAS